MFASGFHDITDIEIGPDVPPTEIASIIMVPGVYRVIPVSNYLLHSGPILHIDTDQKIKRSNP